jgi:2-polyprenyl-3-methyl-5-hydroxy-6-metoxy-1,4-benzoquinol methylase
MTFNRWDTAQADSRAHGREHAMPHDVPRAATVPANGHDKPATLDGTQCPVCFSSVSPLSDLQDFRLFRCRACDCVCSDAIMRGAATSFQTQNYFGHEDADVEKWNDLMRRLRTRSQPYGSALDVGCGRGGFLSYLRAQDPALALTGIELDGERAQHARRSVTGGDIYQGDVEEVLATLDRSFDLITLWDVFEHVPRPRSVLNALAGKLNPNGCLFIQTIHESSVVPLLGRLTYRLTGGRFRALARRTHEAHHLVFFTRKGIRILAREAGLRIEQMWFDRLALSRMDGSRWLTVPASVLLALENLAGNGLFIDLILTRPGGDGRTEESAAISR